MTTYVAASYGALIAMCVLAALFFARYWRSSRDRFFLWFAGAFIMFAIHWGFLLFDASVSEHTPYVYAIRLLGFLAILMAIVAKNRQRAP